jgi:hypothetical protein
MEKTYLLHDNGSVGVADIPKWIDFKEQPYRSFRMCFIGKEGSGIFYSQVSTQYTTPITKEVADILRSLK